MYSSRAITFIVYEKRLTNFDWPNRTAINRKKRLGGGISVNGRMW